MTLTQLTYVLAVDTYRHFGMAAEKCFVTQPTLSMQIQKLEEELDVLIFDRSKQPVVPTEIGQQIIAQARTIVREADRMAEVIQAGKEEIAGTFVLGIIPTVATSLLPLFLKSFAKAYPKVQLTVEELQTHEIIERLKNDRLDAAILATPLEDKGIIERPLYYEPFMAYVPEDHRLAKEAFVLRSELQLDDLLLLNQGHCFRNSVINLCRSAFKGNEQTAGIHLESGSFETLISLARQGLGMTLVPYLKALELKKQKDKLLLKSFEHPQPTREISVVYNRSQLKQQLIEGLSHIIQKSIPSRLLQQPEGDVISPLTS